MLSAISSVGHYRAIPAQPSSKKLSLQAQPQAKASSQKNNVSFGGYIYRGKGCNFLTLVNGYGRSKFYIAHKADNIITEKVNIEEPGIFGIAQACAFANGCVKKFFPALNFRFEFHGKLGQYGEITNFRSAEEWLTLFNTLGDTGADMADPALFQTAYNFTPTKYNVSTSANLFDKLHKAFIEIMTTTNDKKATILCNKYAEDYKLDPRYLINASSLDEDYRLWRGDIQTRLKNFAPPEEIELQP